MSAALLDGNAVADKILSSYQARVARLKRARGRAPTLAIVTAAHPSARAYLQAKLKACARWGIEARVSELPARAKTSAAARLLAGLSRGRADAIVLELPLPAGVDADALLTGLPSRKDPEGLSPENYGRFFLTRGYQAAVSGPAPCTAAAVARLLLETGIDPAGKRAVVVGRSNILGKPAAHLLSLLNASVLLCHSKTDGLQEEVRRADIVVAALGRARLIQGAWIKPGAVVIDAGVNLEPGGLCGDVDFEEARKVASFITPVPGGVGPVTTAMLLANTVVLAEKR